MISGSRNRWLTLLLATPIAAWAQSSTDELDALVARLAVPTPSSTPFVEARFNRLLAKPVVVSGTLSSAGPSRLEKSIAKPYRETTRVDGGNVRIERDGETPRRFALKRAPELEGVLASFGAMLAGDAATLKRFFEPTLARDGERWTIALVPRDAKTRKRVDSMRVLGAGDVPSCFVLREPDGDETWTLVADAAKTPLPAKPTRDDVASRCEGR